LAGRTEAVKDQGMVMYGKPKPFDGMIELGLVRKIEVEDTVAFLAVEMVVGPGSGVETVCGGKGQGGHLAFRS